MSTGFRKVCIFLKGKVTDIFLYVFFNTIMTFEIHPASSEATALIKKALSGDDNSGPTVPENAPEHCPG
jgi:hypothetical protein